MIETLKAYLGLGHDEDDTDRARRARRINTGLIVVVVAVMLFIDSVWLRAVCFALVFALSVVVSLVARDVERAQRPR